MIGSINLSSVLRTITETLQSPVIFLLLVMMALTVFIAGSLIAEVFTERIYIKVKLNTLPDMIEELHRAATSDEGTSIADCIEESKLLKRHKRALTELTKHPDITDLERESLAARLVTQEKSFYDKRTKVTDVMAKIGPMLGLMGTLIPLGPGIIALGQGDTFTLSNSLLIAFDTTVAGLVCALIALVISTIRKIWYRNDMSILETLMECILEEEQNDDQA